MYGKDAAGPGKTDIEEFIFQDILDLVPDHFWMVSEWCYDTFRVVWISKKHLSIFTYCEGDLVLEICENMEVFNENIKKAAEFYKEH